MWSGVDVLEVIEDLPANIFGHFGCETIPFDHILEVAREAGIEGRLVKFLANECARLPLVKTEFNLC